MKITSVGAGNVKGQTFTHDLKDVTMIVGPNAKGKTAILKAIDIALAPKIQPGSYPALSVLFDGFDHMYATCFTDVGTFNRRFERNGDKLTMAMETRPKEISFPPVALDATEYFNLSVDKRTQMVFSMLKLGAEFTEDAVIGELKNRLKLPDNRNNADTEAIVRSIIETVENSTDVIRHGGISVQEWMSGELVSATDRVKLARATKDRMAKSAQASVQIQMTDPSDATPEGIETVESLIRNAQNELQELSDSMGQIRASKDADVGERERRKQKRSSLNGQVAQLPDQSETILALEKNIREADSESKGYKSRTKELFDKFADESIENAKLTGPRDTLLTELTTLAENLKTIDQKPHCDLCKASAEGWRDAVKAEWNAQASKKSIKLAEFNTRIRESNERLADWIKKREESAKEDARIDGLRNSIGTFNRDLRLAQNKQQARTTLMQQLQELGDPTLDDKPPAQNYDAGIDAKQSEINTVSKTLNRLNERLKNATAAAQQASRKAQEENERLKGVAEFDLQTICVEVLKEFQSKMMQAGFNTILTSANLIAPSIMDSALEYRDGDVGRRDSQGRWIAWKSFSGTEQAAAFAAMSYALAVNSPCRIVRVDEMGRLDPNNKKRFIARMVELVKQKQIDQFIGIDTVHSPYSEAEGVHIISLA